MPKKFYLTTPIYYVNDRPHIGHAYTTLAADVIARYHRLLGEDVWFLTGTDEHGAKIAQAASEAGKTPQQFCAEVAGQFQSVWHSLNIASSDFIRTTEPRHMASAQKFLMDLKERGVIYQGEYRGLYCAGCEKFLTEKELVNGLCPDHKKLPEAIKEKNYFFQLKKFLPQVQALIEQDKIKILPVQIKKEVLGLCQQGLEDFSVSREKVSWGIPVPFDQNQVMYVWVDALHNYLSAIGYNEGQHKKWWPADIQLMAKDIIKFHAIYWPAMLLALGEEPPKVVYAHGYFTINGQKMSKTIGNVIDPLKLVKQFGVDGTRYLLLSQFPFGVDGDIRESNFKAKYNSDLAKNFGNLVNRILHLVEQNFSGQLSGVEPTTAGQGQVAWSKITARSWQLVTNYYSNYEIDKVLTLIFGGSGVKEPSILDQLNNYIETTKLWELVKRDQKQAKIVCYEILEVLRHLSLWLWPYLPQTAEKLRQKLGLQKLDNNQQWGQLDPSSKFTKGEPLFPRLK